jgi:type IV fimbrial biogenesis protein FimT
MLVAAVLVILAGLATPGFRELILAQGVKTASFEVMSDLVVARSEAITRNTTVTVAPSVGDWSRGWTISDSAGAVLKRQEALAGVTVAGPGAVTFNGAGRLTTGATSISLMANGGRALHARCISVDLSGRPVARKERCF